MGKRFAALDRYRPKTQRRKTDELRLGSLRRRLIGARLVVKRLDPNVAKTHRAIVILEKYRTNRRLLLLLPNDLEVGRRVIAIRMIGGPWLAKAGVLLHLLTVEPGSNGAFLNNLPFLVTARRTVADIVHLPFARRPGSVY